ncbi:MAG: hypothetical protein LBR31_03610 [Desulfovibrio sp.]|jgi:cytochrome c-type biogenesis protein CcmH/NrfG|nr:hypothetical protein [Desulfovibrio sp.]
MNPRKNQAVEPASLLSEIQTEVSAESAPLLNFMLRHANAMVALVVGLLLLVAGVGAWQWRSGVKNAEAADEIARVCTASSGEARIRALADLARTAPDRVRLSAYMTLGQYAAQDGDDAAAAEAYAQAARLAGEGPFAAAALLARAGALLRAGNSAEALSLLQDVEQRLPQRARIPQLRQMIAEAAISAGQKDVAAAVYMELAQAAPEREGEYFRARAAALEGKKDGEK